jgi:hypothetical protein
MAVAAIPCFMVEQCFGSYYAMEIPYYVAALGAATLSVASREASATAQVDPDELAHIPPPALEQLAV